MVLILALLSLCYPSHSFVQPLNSSDSFTRFLDSEDASVVGFLDHPAHAMAFEQAAANAPHFRWAVTNSSELFAAQKLRNAVAVFKPPRLLSHGERPRSRYPGNVLAHPEALVDFVARVSQPLVGVLTEASAHAYEALGLPVLVVFCELDWEQNTMLKYYIERLRSLALKFEARMRFALASKRVHRAALGNYGIRWGDWELQIGVYHTHFRSVGEEMVPVPEFFRMADVKGLDVASVERFCESYLVGGVEKAVPVVDNEHYDTLSSLANTLGVENMNELKTNHHYKKEL